MLPSIATVFAMLEALPLDHCHHIIVSTSVEELRYLIHEGMWRLSREQLETSLMGLLSNLKAYARSASDARQARSETQHGKSIPPTQLHTAHKRPGAYIDISGPDLQGPHEPRSALPPDKHRPPKQRKMQHSTQYALPIPGSLPIEQPGSYSSLYPKTSQAHEFAVPIPPATSQTYAAQTVQSALGQRQPDSAPEVQDELHTEQQAIDSEVASNNRGSDSRLRESPIAVSDSEEATVHQREIADQDTERVEAATALKHLAQSSSQTRERIEEVIALGNRARTNMEPAITAPIRDEVTLPHEQRPPVDEADVDGQQIEQLDLVNPDAADSPSKLSSDYHRSRSSSTSRIDCESVSSMESSLDVLQETSCTSVPPNPKSP
jgi:hypothetical protein